MAARKRARDEDGNGYDDDDRGATNDTESQDALARARVEALLQDSDNDGGGGHRVGGCVEEAYVAGQKSSGTGEGGRRERGTEKREGDIVVCRQAATKDSEKRWRCVGRLANELEEAARRVGEEEVARALSGVSGDSSLERCGTKRTLALSTGGVSGVEIGGGRKEGEGGGGGTLTSNNEQRQKRVKREAFCGVDVEKGGAKGAGGAEGGGKAGSGRTQRKRGCLEGRASSRERRS